MSKKVNRNDPCPCGSDKKYKNCCLKKESQAARYTAEGKFKFTAEVINPSKNYSSLFQSVMGSFHEDTKEPPRQFHVSKVKEEAMGKKAVRRAQAKEERLISKKLQKHSFEVVDATSSQSVPSQPSIDDVSFTVEEFIPTQEDFRIDFEKNKNS